MLVKNKEAKRNLTLDQTAVYRISVPGHLDESWSEWDEGIEILVVDDPPVTTLTSAMDQAALQGLLRRLYSMGVPLISVTCVDEAG